MDGRVLREVLDKPIPGLGRPVGEMLLNSTGLQAIRNRLHSLEHTLEAGVAEATHQGMERIVTPLKDRLLEVGLRIVWWRPNQSRFHSRLCW